MSCFETTPGRRQPWRFLAVGLPALLLTATVSAVSAQTGTSDETVAEELVVVESSILLQRAGRTRVENVEVEVDGSLAEAVAVYSLREVEFPATVYFDLCAPSFSRLTRAVGMVAAVGEQLRARGPVSVVATGPDGGRVLVRDSTDALSFEAALTLVLRSPVGGCDDATPLAGLKRVRDALALVEGASTSPSLLLLYGFDHDAISAEDLRRFQPEFAAVGAELAGNGRTIVVLVPQEGDRRLREDEVRSVLPDPEGPPRVIDLGAVLGAIISPRRIVPDDRRVIEIATDPRNELVRDLIATGHGRLFAFSRQLEAFALELSGYHVLFYRSRYRQSEAGGTLVPIEVRSRSGGAIASAKVASRAQR